MRLLARHYDTQWRARSGGPDSRGEVRTGVWIGGCVGVRQGRGRATHQHVARIPDGEPGWPSRPSGPGVMAEEAPPPSLPPPLSAGLPAWPAKPPRRLRASGHPLPLRPATRPHVFWDDIRVPGHTLVPVAGSGMKKVHSFSGGT